jgi:hypothetical protein
LRSRQSQWSPPLLAAWAAPAATEPSALPPAKARGGACLGFGAAGEEGAWAPVGEQEDAGEAGAVSRRGWRR